MSLDLTAATQPMTEDDLIRILRVFARALRGQPASSASLDQLAAQLTTISQEQQTMSQSLADVQTQVTGLRADLTAAQQRVQLHDDATAKAIADLNTQIASLKSTPADTSAQEAALAAIAADLQAARSQAQAIEPDTAAASAGTAAGAGGATDTSGSATAATGSDTTGGAAAGTTADTGAPTGTAVAL